MTKIQLLEIEDFIEGELDYDDEGSYYGECI